MDHVDSNWEESAMKTVPLLLALFALCASAHAQDLERSKKDKLGRVNYNLDSTERSIEKGKANIVEMYLKRAISGWNELQKELSRIEKANSDVRMTGVRMKLIRARAEGVGVVIVPELSSKAKSSLTGMDRHLNSAKRFIQKKNASLVKRYIQYAEKEWEIVLGELTDETREHPDVVKAKEALAKVKSDAEAAGISTAPELNSTVQGYIKKIHSALDSAERFLGQGNHANFKSYVNRARMEWEYLGKAHADKFKPDHPEIVKLKKRIGEVEAVGKAAGVDMSPKLPQRVNSALADIDKHLNSAESFLEKGNGELVERYLAYAEKTWRELKRDHGEQFKDDHPEVTKARDRMASVRTNGVEAGLISRFPKLPDRVKSALKSVQSHIDKATAAIETDKADLVKRYVTFAHKEWNGMVSSYGGQFDESHPDVARVKTALDGVVDTAETAGIRTGMRLPAEVKDLLVFVNGNLAEAEKAVAKKDFAGAGAPLEKARSAWKTITGEHAGDFPKDHPTVVATRNRLDKVDLEVASASAPKLSAQVQYELKKVTNALDMIERGIRKNDQLRVDSYFAKAISEWGSLKKNHGTKFEEDHPEIRRVLGKLDRLVVQAAAEGLFVTNSVPGMAGEALDAVRKELGSTEMAINPPARVPPSMQLGPKSIRLKLAGIHYILDAILVDHGELLGTAPPSVVQLREILAGLRRKAIEKGITPDELEETWNNPDCAPLEEADRAAVAAVSKSLDWAHHYIRQEIMSDNVKSTFQKADDDMKGLNARYSGNRLVSAHPDFKRVTHTHRFLKEWYTGFAATAGVKAKMFIEFMESVGPYAKKLDKIKSKLYWATSADEPDPEKIRMLVSDVYSMMPSAVAAAKSFRKAFPGDLEDHVFKYMGTSEAAGGARDGEQALYSIEQNAANLEKELLNNAAKYIKQAESSLTTADDFVKIFQEDPKMAHLADSSARQADHAEVRAISVQVIFPLKIERGQVERNLGDEQKELSRRADRILERVLAVRKAVAIHRKEETDAAKLKLQRARFPKAKKTGGDWDELAGKAKAIILRDWKEYNQKALEARIMSDWEERREWVQYGNTHSWEEFKFFWAAVAVDLGKENTYRVYWLSFRRMKTSDGWGKLKYWGVGSSWEILKENLDK
jgi:hypothetical protein